MQTDQKIFETIVNDLRTKGYSIQPYALPDELADALINAIVGMDTEDFKSAGVGRDTLHQINHQVRRDTIHWIDEKSPTGRDWLAWMGDLQSAINRQLFLGLDYYESHFAHYREGAFYKRHVDAFVGQDNRVLSTVAYLNRDWPSDAGGELVLYRDEQDQTGIKVVPEFATLVVFLSEEFPHEVLPARRERYSIAGWFRRRGGKNTIFA
ncbi:2OG-Fe(II) oxygenase [Alteromonas sp. ASW11-36]|uniref:2OG-Fe(II) oxygenase n=1 Tax=Alteromonas arenosi TaxID=3055817 RepID=A0ABT7SZE6_9ALTE|nr:2OG-Fe(II) oxygenase [Alteromonas sp. ASW11-36]MDM7861558.1 2OG-Fe(II) oxygenase [Alteromonas sp. ASW11-36]